MIPDTKTNVYALAAFRKKHAVKRTNDTYLHVSGRYVAGVYFHFSKHAEPVELENQVQLVADGIV